MYLANLQVFRQRLPYVVSRLMEIHLHAYGLSSSVGRTRLCPCRRRAKDAVQCVRLYKSHLSPIDPLRKGRISSPCIHRGAMYGVDPQRLVAT